jgi:hypothetical protein
MEKLHVPTVYLTTSQFNINAHLSAEDNGVPNLRIVAVPANKYYSERLSKERAKPVAAAAFDEMIKKMITPITPEESTPKPKAAATPNIKVTAESSDAALEKFNELFLEKHWSDGLPIIPPTPERVKWMLSGTTRSPKEVIGTVAPRNGTATVENVAINAVMAGAKPEYFPVILAAMDALVDETFDDLHFLTSTGSFNLVIMVSGPIAKEIDMNSGLGMLSFGSRANSSIGRTIRLCGINLGHLWPGENDMALVGRPSAHTFITFAENQEYSPWEPYHVSQGFKATDSCVTIAVTGGYSTGSTGLSVYGGGAVALVPPESILNSLVQQMTRGKNSRHLVVFNPEVAQELSSRLGYTRDSLKKYFQEKAGVSPESTHILVAGGIPGYTLAMSGYLHGIYKDKAQMTKLITGAKLTKAGSGPPISQAMSTGK